MNRDNSTSSSSADRWTKRPEKAEWQGVEFAESRSRVSSGGRVSSEGIAEGNTATIGNTNNQSAMSRGSILVVEDDRSLADVLEYNLTDAGYTTHVCYDGQEGLRQARLLVPDVVVLDLMLPIIDGMEICRRLRGDAATRGSMVLMLTAKSEETDQVAGFSVGADDYVTKPFSVKVLLERVRALMRRRKGDDDKESAVSSQGVIVDRQRHRVTAGDVPLDLTPSEFSLLESLMRQPGRVFSRSELIDSALGGDSLVLERTIDVHIRALRKKLGTHAHLVETVRGIGYRFRDPFSG